MTEFDASMWEGVAVPPHRGASRGGGRRWLGVASLVPRAGGGYISVAEEAGVKLALHPDDPPLSPVRGIGRIVRSLEAYERVFALQPSPRGTG